MIIIRDRPQIVRQPGHSILARTSPRFVIHAASYHDCSHSNSRSHLKYHNSPIQWHGLLFIIDHHGSCCVRRCMSPRIHFAISKLSANIGCPGRFRLTSFTNSSIRNRNQPAKAKKKFRVKFSRIYTQLLISFCCHYLI